MPSAATPFKLPHACPRSERRPVPDDVLDRIQALYDQSRYLDAWEIAQGSAPLHSWQGAKAQVLGYRLGQLIGASRTSALLINRARRENPRDTRVAVYFGYYLADRRGPIVAWEHAGSTLRHDDPADKDRADLLAQQARIASTYRDFRTAWNLMNEARALRPDSPWLATEQSALMQREDRNEEAFAPLDEALALQPWYRPASQHRARLLQLLGRSDEAIAYLEEATRHIQCSAVALQLWQLRRERDENDGMLDLLDHIQTLTPGAEPDFTDWILAKRADALYLKGDFAAAADAAEGVSGEFYPAFAVRLRSVGDSGRRVRLPVRFVLQDHNTCGPATLAAITAYWGAGVAQHDIVAAISYDGTNDHNERRWCEENGFAVSEFTVTWESARRLLDAGIPFALATVEVDSAHLQAVIGYDELRESLIIQDPGEPSFREVSAKEFLAEYVLTGPRGMALVPTDRAKELDALALPDRDLFDKRYAFALALAEYRREVAAEILADLEETAPGHPLTRYARLSLASFDGNSPERVKCVAALLEEYPENPRVLFWQLQVLRETGRHEDRVLLLRRALDGPGFHPIFLKELAGELSADGRRRFETRRLLLRAHRGFPENSATLVELADLLWVGQKDDRLLDYYRFAAARSDKHEGFARTWFFAARLLHKDEAVLAWLRWRFDTYGARSGAPAVTLASCLDHLARTADALSLLDEALLLRPEDGELLVQAAGFFTRSGRIERARELLDRARGRCPESQWQRAYASLLDRLGEPTDALGLWQEILHREPLAVDAHRETARLLSRLRGESEALDHLAAACERFPHHNGLGEIHLSWLRDNHVKEAIQVARSLIEIHPAGSWARRELAILLNRDGRLEEALEEAREVLDLSPGEPASHGIAAMLASADGNRGEAELRLHEAIRLDVNYGWAVEELIGQQHGTAAKRAALDFVRSEMIRQVLNGDMLHTYRGVAYPVVDPTELLSQLREIWEARPDLWETWSTLSAQSLDAGNVDEALALAIEATERFPLLPGAWRDLASIHRLRGEKEEAIKAIRQAVELNPDWELAWRIEADYLEDSGHRVEAIETLRRAARRLPLEGFVHAMLASLLWRNGETEEAWKTASDLIRRDPGFEFLWRQLTEWSGLLGRREELVALARQTTIDRPGEARSWLILAQVLPFSEVFEELSALDRAISLNPRLEDAYDQKAVALCRNGRFEEAEATLRSGPWGDPLPMTLEGRLAWLSSVRGNPKEALERMTSVVDRHRDYYWGWERCAEWAEVTNDSEAWKRAAGELMRLAPRDPGPCFNAAVAEEAAGNRAESIRLLRRSLHLDPGYPAAAGRLLSYLSEKGSSEELESFASEILEGGPTRAAVRAARALAAALRGDRSSVERQLEMLVAETEYVYETSNTIHRAFQEKMPRKMRQAYQASLDLAVREHRIGPSFARLWLTDRIGSNRWDVWKHFEDWIDRLGERSLPAILEYLDGIGSSGKAGQILPLIVAKHGAFLREYTEAWGKMGYALTTSGLHSANLAWLADAPQRADAEGWILANLVSSLRHLEREDEAIQVSREAVSRGLQDQTWDWHLAFAAYGEALDGNAESARRLLSTRGSGELPATYAVLSRMASAMCEVIENAETGLAKTAFRRELSKLRWDLKDMIKPDDRMRKSYRRTINAMAARAGSWLPVWQRPWPGEIGWFQAILLVIGFLLVLGLIIWEP